MDDYFAFFEIKEKFIVDELALKKRYQDISRTNHPDYFIEDVLKYDEALRVTSVCNSGYKALSKFTNRVHYILKLNGMLEESGNAIPQEFLMQVMDINESLMDLQMDFDAKTYEIALSEWSGINSGLDESILSKCKKADLTSNQEDRVVILQEIKDFYLKQKYLLRIKETLDKFALN
ncbi:MAG: molecular chaperone HscB [Bacteroidia bacterium]|jgi:molecular chaperone HscB